MKLLSTKWHCHIDITTICHSTCLYCSRYMRHTRSDDRWHMPLDYFMRALDSLDEWPNRIGLMGGEPTLHPQFAEICDYMRTKQHPKYPNIMNRYSLFTAGGAGYERNKEVIGNTFHYVEVFEHNPQQASVCKHQPLTMAIDDLIDDPVLKNKLINNCWADQTWCATITPKGGFFCEIAAAINRVTNGPAGFDISDPHWWARPLDDPDYLAQVKQYCGLCGAPVPLVRETLDAQKERISEGLYNILKDCGSPGLTPEKCEVVRGKLTQAQIDEALKTWWPGTFRQDVYGDVPAPQQGC